MKANQKFVRNDEGVSPVIGVILMVAITVVLAAVVFILVNDLGSAGEEAPSLSFNKDAAQGTLTVVKADTPANDWSQFDVGSNACHATLPTGDVSAGDIITLNLTAVAPQVAGQSCSFTLTHTPTNTLIYDTTFTLS